MYVFLWHIQTSMVCYLKEHVRVYPLHLRLLCYQDKINNHDWECAPSYASKSAALGKITGLWRRSGRGVEQASVSLAVDYAYTTPGYRTSLARKA